MGERRKPQRSAVTQMRVSVHRAELLDDLGYQPPGHCVLADEELPEHDDVDHEDGLPRALWGFRRSHRWWYRYGGGWRG